MQSKNLKFWKIGKYFIKKLSAKTLTVDPIAKFCKESTNAISYDEAIMNLPRQCFFYTWITVVGKQLFLIVFELRFAFVRKIAKILAAQSSAQTTEK